MIKKVTDIKKITQAIGRDVFMAGLGVVSIASDSSQKAFGNLVERGKARQQDTDKDTTVLKEKLAERTTGIRSSLTELAKRPVVGVMTTIGLPTSREIEELNTRIQTLTDKINQLAPATK